jgi:hypothetical protein
MEDQNDECPSADRWPDVKCLGGYMVVAFDEGLWDNLPGGYTAIHIVEADVIQIYDRRLAAGRRSAHIVIPFGKTGVRGFVAREINGDCDEQGQAEPADYHDQRRCGQSTGHRGDGPMVGRRSEEVHR